MIQQLQVIVYPSSPAPWRTEVFYHPGLEPPDGFTLTGGDRVTIEIAGIGKLVNQVAPE
jgi:hypothetical protein